ncbi:hypothetical protein GCM10022286_23570 [Gryllotalpicola daejeonensis]|uniref:LysM domain-containing protein n=2 Tax=Gryllotalpicola daejeonensis TaxID=993087 RepID=A0ABP7ZLM3_9MICO
MAPLTAPRDAGPQLDATGDAKATTATTFAYTVEPSDTISAIAYRFGLCNADIYGANDWLNGHDDQLLVGQTLTIQRVAAARHDAADCHTAVYD